jgi:hypothetical protein
MQSLVRLEVAKEEFKNLMRVLLPQEFYYMEFLYVKRALEKRRIRLSEKEFKKILALLFREGYWEWVDFNRGTVRQNHI